MVNFVKCEDITPPKDGRLLLLIVAIDITKNDEGWHPLEATDDPFVTIGYNVLEDTQEDRWIICGWNWYQDCFTNTDAKVLAWATYPELPMEYKTFSEDQDIQ